MTLCPQLRHLGAEHARWQARIAAWAGEEEATRCARLTALWEEEILPHCRAEEDVLLPELAARLSEADAAVVFTMGDHVVLRRLARDLRAAEGEERRAAREALELKLVEHARFEERTLFPALQGALGCDRIAGLADEIARRSLPPARPAPARARPAGGRRRRG